MSNENGAVPAAVRPRRTKDEIIEIIVVVMLGVTALLTAWAGWIGSLHGGNQATSYTTSNNLAAEGNSEYNAAIQTLNQDELLWENISDMQWEITFASEKGDTDEVEKYSYKLMTLLDENLSEEMAEKIGWDMDADYSDADPVDVIADWLQKDEATVSPFYDDDFVQSYFDKANDLLDQSEEQKEIGQEANACSDRFGLVTVIYSIVLFILGIINTFDNTRNKTILLIVSCIAFVIATVYMITIPMPEGFSLIGYFKS